jgi:glycosylphosphatidylinositol transamidase
MLPAVFFAFAVINNIFPFFASAALTQFFSPTSQQYQLTKAFSLLFLGMFLSTLATLNFSLAFLVGLLSAPLTYIQSFPGRPILTTLFIGLLSLLAPTTVCLAGTTYWNLGIGEVLKEAAFGWDVWGMNTQVVVWCVWWPAWVVGMIQLAGKPKDVSEAVKHG